MLGIATIPRFLYFPLKIVSRCFQKHCITPKLHLNRCFKNCRKVSGASVKEMASVQLRMIKPFRKSRMVRSQSSASVSVVKPPAIKMASLLKAPIAPGTTVMQFKRSKALRSKFCEVIYSILCHRVIIFTSLPTFTFPATAPTFSLLNFFISRLTASVLSCVSASIHTTYPAADF